MSLNEEVLGMLAPLSKDGLLKIANDQATLIQTLNRRFYFSGSKIDWTKSTDHWHQSFRSSGESIDVEEKHRAVEEILRKHDFPAVVERTIEVDYINDSSLEFGVRLSPIIFWDAFAILLPHVPQHHYFFSADGSWCLAITMEGFVDFGRAAK